MSPMHDRPWSRGGGGGGGGASRFFARLFENPENPLGWSVKLFTAGGITVRLHLIFILYAAGMMLWSIPKGNAGIAWTALGMACLFVIVVLHEFGHCYACRLVGGEADRIVMCPWGGLALCRPPHDWKAHFITTFGGPGVNLILFPVFAGFLFLAGLGRHVVFNPFEPWRVLTAPEFNASATLLNFGKAALWWLHYTNIVIFGFNMLLVFFPFDAGRLIQAILWRFRGYGWSMEVALMVGLAGATLLGVFGLVAGHSTLVAIAVFGVLTCWMERRRLRGEFELGDPSYAPGSGKFIAVPVEGDEFARLAKKQAKERERAAREQAEVDRILAKIAREGMGSLSRGERKTLEGATKKKRGE